MRRFRVHALDRETGVAQVLELDSSSEEAAIKLAATRGFLVESIEPILEVAVSPQRAPPVSKVIKPIRPLSYGQGMTIIFLMMVGMGFPIFSLFKPATPPRPAKWEYEIVSSPDELLSSELEMRGRLGWELTFARRVVNGDGESSKAEYEMIFRRQILDER